MADHGVSALAVRAQLIGPALADHAEAVGIVDVHQSVVLSGQRRERVQVGGVSRHRVHAVHGDEPRRGLAAPQELLQVSRIVVAKPDDGRSVTLGDHRAVVDRLVGAAVQEHRPAAGQDRDDGHVDVRDRGKHQCVLGAEELGHPLLDLLVQHGAAEQPRPRRMRPPRVEEGGNGLDDLAVDVETEIVAAGEVEQPLLADADPTSVRDVDLVDHRVEHGMGLLEPRQVRDRRRPALEPSVVAPPQRLLRARRLGRAVLLALAMHPVRLPTARMCPAGSGRDSRHAFPIGRAVGAL
jgi:hypothetical protein